MKVSTPELPESCLEFARQMAELAKKNGIEKFSTKFTPECNIGDKYSYVDSDVTIIYSATDGRGRPCENLQIVMNARLTTNVVETASSFS